MNFQPPKPEVRRNYTDGLSIVRSTVTPLQPLAKPSAAIRESVLAHRIIRVSRADTLGLPASRRSSSSLADMRTLTLVGQPVVVSARGSILLRHATSAVAAQLTSWRNVFAHKNWYALVPAIYKKYSAAAGVTVNNTFKRHGVTFVLAAFALLALTVLPGFRNLPSTPVASSEAAAAAAAAAKAANGVLTSGAQTAQDIAKAKAGPAPVAAAPSTVSEPVYRQPLLETDDIVKEVALPVADNDDPGVLPVALADAIINTPSPVTAIVTGPAPTNTSNSATPASTIPKVPVTVGVTTPPPTTSTSQPKPVVPPTSSGSGATTGTTTTAPTAPPAPIQQPAATQTATPQQTSTPITAGSSVHSPS